MRIEILSRLYSVIRLEEIDHTTTRITLKILGGPTNNVKEADGICPRNIYFSLPRIEAAKYPIGRMLWLSLTDGK